MTRARTISLLLAATCFAAGPTFAKSTKALSVAASKAAGMTLRLSDTETFPIISFSMAVFEAKIKLPIGRSGARLNELAARKAVEKIAVIGLSAKSRIQLTHVTVVEYGTEFEGSSPVAVLTIKYDGAQRTDD